MPTLYAKRTTFGCDDAGALPPAFGHTYPRERALVIGTHPVNRVSQIQTMLYAIRERERDK